jgi:hypothetical protein
MALATTLADEDVTHACHHISHHENKTPTQTRTCALHRDRRYILGRLLFAVATQRINPQVDAKLT